MYFWGAGGWSITIFYQDWWKFLLNPSPQGGVLPKMDTKMPAKMSLAGMVAERAGFSRSLTPHTLFELNLSHIDVAKTLLDCPLDTMIEHLTVQER